MVRYLQLQSSAIALIFLAISSAVQASSSLDEQACTDMVAAFELQDQNFNRDEVVKYCLCMQRVNREVGFAPSEEEMEAFKAGGAMPPKMIEATMKATQECKLPQTK